jgi:hypothetical protein
MVLPIIGWKVKISWIVWLVAIVSAGFIGYRSYQIHRDNIVWAITHSRPAEICRLENTRDELIKIKQLDETEKILEEVGK